MRSKALNSIGIKAPFFAVLFAWLAFQSVNILHLGEIDHTEATSHNCIMCTHSALDDGLDTPSTQNAITQSTFYIGGLFVPTSFLPTGLLVTIAHQRAPPLL
jgi:hypothetical protein